MPLTDKQENSRKRRTQTDGNKGNKDGKRKPKRPLSAYDYFVVEERKRILNGDGKNPSRSADIGTVSKRWSEVEGDELHIYERKAAADSERYRREMKEYREEQLNAVCRGYKNQVPAGQSKNNGDDDVNQINLTGGEVGLTGSTQEGKATADISLKASCSTKPIDACPLMGQELFLQQLREFQRMDQAVLDILQQMRGNPVFLASQAAVGTAPTGMVGNVGFFTGNPYSFYPMNSALVGMEGNEAFFTDNPYSFYSMNFAPVGMEGNTGLFMGNHCSSSRSSPRNIPSGSTAWTTCAGDRVPNGAAVVASLASQSISKPTPSPPAAAGGTAERPGKGSSGSSRSGSALPVANATTASQITPQPAPCPPAGPADMEEAIGKGSNDNSQSAAAFPKAKNSIHPQSSPEVPSSAPADTRGKGSSGSSQSAADTAMAKATVDSKSTLKPPPTQPVPPTGTTETKGEGSNDSSQSAAASPTAKAGAAFERTPTPPISPNTAPAGKVYTTGKGSYDSGQPAAASPMAKAEVDSESNRKAPQSPPTAPSCTEEMTGRGNSDSSQSQRTPKLQSARPATRARVPAKRPIFRPVCPKKKKRPRATPISRPQRNRSRATTGSDASATCAKPPPSKSSAGHSIGAKCKSPDNQEQGVCPRSAAAATATSPRQSPAAGATPQTAAFSSSAGRQGGGSSRPTAKESAKKKQREQWRDDKREKWRMYKMNRSRADRSCRDQIKSKADEQERLFREAAQRVKTNLGQGKGDNTTPRVRVVPGDEKQVQCPSFKLPVEDVSSLPADHWRWTDPFARLGLPKSSGLDMVKRNYRRLALLYHPDKIQAGRADVGEEGDNSSSVVHARFHAIKDAFEVLSRDKK